MNFTSIRIEGAILSADLESIRDVFFDDPPRFKVVVETLKGWEEFFNRTLGNI